MSYLLCSLLRGDELIFPPYHSWLHKWRKLVCLEGLYLVSQWLKQLLPYKYICFKNFTNVYIHSRRRAITEMYSLHWTHVCTCFWGGETGKWKIPNLMWLSVKETERCNKARCIWFVWDNELLLTIEKSTVCIALNSTDFTMPNQVALRAKFQASQEEVPKK